MPISTSLWCLQSQSLNIPVKALIVCVCVSYGSRVSVLRFRYVLSFRVIDLGVMVPCDKILREAITRKAGTTIYRVAAPFFSTKVD